MMATEKDMEHLGDLQAEDDKTRTTPWGYIWGGSKYSGVACMALSSISYSLMGLLVKLLSVRSFPSFQVVLSRCLVITTFSFVELRRMKHPLLGSPSVKHFVIARALIGFVALSSYFYSIQALTLRDATILNFTMPVFTAIFATCLLHERWGVSEAVGSFWSFIGVILIMQPELVYTARSNIRVASFWSNYLGISMAMVGASTGALSYIIVRVIGMHGEPPLVCVFAFAAFSCPLAALATIFQGFKLPNLPELIGLLLVGLTAYAAQIFLTRGLQLEKASRATSIQYVKVLCTYMLGVLFLQEKPSIASAIGAALIAFSALFISYRSSCNPKMFPKATT